jgi:hypothetical protein
MASGARLVPRREMTTAVPHAAVDDLGLEPASPIEPPPRDRLERILETLVSVRQLPPPPGLPRGVPRLHAPLARPPSLLMVGEVLGEAAVGHLRRRGFRKAVDVEDLADALGALSERRYDAVAIWDHVHEQPLRFVRALLGFERAEARDPLLPLLTSRLNGVPVALLHAHGGYAVFCGRSEWYLSEPGGPDWAEALQAVMSPRA